MTIKRMSPATAALLAKAYPHKSNDELALQFDMRAKTIKEYAWRHRLQKAPEVKSMACRVSRSGISAEVLAQQDAYLREHWPTGTHVDVIAAALGISPGRARDRATRLELRRPIKRRQPKPAKVLKLKALPARKKAPAKPASDLPMVIPPGLKIQRGPAYTHNGKYQLPPGERVVGGWSTLGIGRYLEGEAA